MNEKKNHWSRILKKRWEVNLSLFYFSHHASVRNFKYNKGTKVKIKLPQLSNSTNKYEKGFFLCLGRIQVSSLLSQSIQQRVPARTPGSHEAPVPTFYFTVTLRQWHPDLCCARYRALSTVFSSQNSLSGGHAMETKLHTFTKKKKKNPHVLWHVIENHDLVWK